MTVLKNPVLQHYSDTFLSLPSTGAPLRLPPTPSMKVFTRNFSHDRMIETIALRESFLFW